MYGSPVPLPRPDQESVGERRRVFLVVVDGSREMRAALRFACQRAVNTGGRVALLSVVKPPEFQHWMFVGSVMQEEARLEAEQLLQSRAAEVHAISGEMPELFLREGDTREELFQLVNEDDGISVVVLGAASGPEGPGPLISALTGKYAGKLCVPVTMLPGDLTDEQIDALT